MKNQIIALDEKNRKVFGFSDEQIIISSKNHDSFESLQASAEKSGMLESVVVVPMSSVKEVFYNEKKDTFTLKYEKKGKVKKTEISLDDSDARVPLVDEIASLKQFNKSVTEESKTKPLLMNLLGVGLISLLTFGFRSVAVDAQNGEHYVATGRRSGIKQLVANAAEALGPTGVTALGAIALLIMLYVTYNRYVNPASEVKYC